MPVIVVLSLALAAWASAFVHMLLLLPHRRDDLSLLTLFFSGWRFYSADSWKPSGHAIHRRFLGSALAFFLLLVLAVPVGALTSSR